MFHQMPICLDDEEESTHGRKVKQCNSFILFFKAAFSSVDLNHLQNKLVSSSHNSQFAIKQMQQLTYDRAHTRVQRP